MSGMEVFSANPQSTTSPWARLRDYDCMGEIPFPRGELGSAFKAIRLMFFGRPDQLLNRAGSDVGGLVSVATTL
jgi:hypothetical protein